MGHVEMNMCAFILYQQIEALKAAAEYAKGQELQVGGWTLQQAT